MARDGPGPLTSLGRPVDSVVVAGLDFARPRSSSSGGTVSVQGRLGRVGCLSRRSFAASEEKRPEEMIMNWAEFHRERVIIGDAEYHVATKAGAP
jgi:hypothetical protein